MFFVSARYFIAFVVLLVYYLAKGNSYHLKKLAKKDWLLLTALGFFFVFLTQGLLILTLNQLSPITASMVLNFSALFIAILGVFFLKEKLKLIQWGGVVVFLLGVLIFFNPISIPKGSTWGLILAGLTVLGNSISSILGRFINRSKRVDPLTVTVVSLGVGSVLLVAVSLLVDPFPSLSLIQWGMILWLAAVNTSFAFVLWNSTLQVLHAAESSMINNTMLIQIAILAWLFIGEAPAPKDWVGMIIATVGIMFVTGLGKKSNIEQ
jgi:drug/metabolite transporter (DMT)-like permease